jgi:hypothetical protein
MGRAGAFNTGNQAKPTWVERSALACDLLAPAIEEGRIARISDVGCGDQKLAGLIDQRGWAIAYKGFDLVPQADNVDPLDLNASPPPGSSDAAVALGVLEYVDDPGACLRRLAAHAPLLVVSHTIRDAAALGEGAAHERGWKNHLFAADFENLLAVNGWRIVDARSTANGLTRIWLAEREVAA